MTNRQRVLIGLLACWAALACALGGCADYTTATTQPAALSPAEQEFQVVWQASKDVLRKWRFEFDRQDRRAGIITTLPMTGEHFFEFWRRDAATGFDLAESTLQTIYRRATVTIRPGDAKTSAFVPTVEVRTYRSDRQAPQVTSTSEAYSMFILPGDERGRRRFLLRGERPQRGVAEGPDDAMPEWFVPLGRDVNLEKRLTDEIISVAARSAAE